MPRPIGIGEITSLWPFLKSTKSRSGEIDWSDERWLQGLMAFHLLCTFTLIIGRNYSIIQILVFILLLLLVFLSENINEWAARNYRLFSHQQYFDSNGLFISVVFSLPALLNCFLIVMFWFVDTGKMMVKVKRAKVRHRNRAASTADDKKPSQTESVQNDGHILTDSNVETKKEQ